jgi:3-oxoadipate enol-lactonase
MGSGPVPVVYLPGAADGLRTATDVAQTLAWFFRERLSKQRLLILSRRQPIPAGFSIAQHAADVIDTMQSLRWGPAVLECNSAGGPIGQWIAVSRPDLVRGLVLSSSLHRASTRIQAVLEHWLRLAEEGRSDDPMLHAIERSYKPPDDCQSLGEAPPSPAVAADEPTRLKNILAGLIGLDHRELLPRIACPALVIAGAEDRFIPTKLQHEMAALIPDSRLVLCAGYGHHNDTENPAYQEHVDRFIESIAEGAIAPSPVGR